MENIVHKFATISFQPTENRSAPIFPTVSTFAWNLKPAMPPENMLDSDSADSCHSDDIESQQSLPEDTDESDSNNNNKKRIGRRGGVARRRMPSRTSKDHCNRVSSAIMKSEVKKKRKGLQTNEQMLKSIEKLYTSRRLKKFTPANLETIFEEPSDENAADAEDDSEECAIASQVNIVKFGNRKLRRAISFSDGLNKNKILIKKRRLKVKKTFGKRLALKKISMDEFHDRLNKSLDSAMEDDEPSLAAPKKATFSDDMQISKLEQLQPTAFE